MLVFTGFDRGLVVLRVLLFLDVTLGIHLFPFYFHLELRYQSSRTSPPLRQVMEELLKPAPFPAG